MNSQSNASDTMELLRNNFERHYNSNKAPFGIYFQAAWFEIRIQQAFLDLIVSLACVCLPYRFQANPYILTGYIQFLNYLSTLQDVYIVSVGKVTRVKSYRSHLFLYQKETVHYIKPGVGQPSVQLKCFFRTYVFALSY